ncbi:MarR family winged helix-turn-helix transcriptional regulator [Mesoterricola sediminis]|nr:MarR family transcriptional regulator [Mesoterricola sediminis]
MLIVAARRSIRQLVAAKAVPLDLTPHHVWMLLVISRAAPLSLGELARAMWMDNPTISRMVQQMTQRGYLVVGPDPNHGRRIRIRLTPEGVTLCEQLEALGEGLRLQSERGMTEEETEALRALLTKYMRNLDVMVANDLPGMPIRPHPKDAEPGSLSSVS